MIVAGRIVVGQVELPQRYIRITVSAPDGIWLSCRPATNSYLRAERPMTEPTTEKLARALEQLPGVPQMMIDQARSGIYDDYKSPLDFPLSQLLKDLGRIGTPAAAAFADRVKAGEFDGTREEAEAWGQSPEGRQAFRELFGR